MLLISDRYVYCSPTKDQSCYMGNLELFVLYRLAFLEGHGNLVSRFVMGIIEDIIWLVVPLTLRVGAISRAVM